MYIDGTNETDKCLGKQVIVILVFTCNETALWDSSVSDVTQWLMGYDINEEDGCQVRREGVVDGGVVSRIVT